MLCESNYNQPASPIKFLGWQSKKTAFLPFNKSVSILRLTFIIFMLGKWKPELPPSGKTVRAGREGKVKFLVKIKLQSVCVTDSVTLAKSPGLSFHFFFNRMRNCCPCIMLGLLCSNVKKYTSSFKRKGLMTFLTMWLSSTRRSAMMLIFKMVMCFPLEFFPLWTF